MNLGSAVRVIHNMGFDSVAMVQPRCEVGMEARSFAMKGAKLLDSACFYPSLEAASGQLSVLVGTSGRLSNDYPRLSSCRHFVETILPELAMGPVGIVFGSEDNGLSREELSFCQWLIEITTSSRYPVINLAQAVAIVAYEMNLGLQENVFRSSSREADSSEILNLLGRIEGVVGQLDLPTRVSSQRLMHRIQKIISRTPLEREDVRMLHGLLRHIQKRTR